MTINCLCFVHFVSILFYPGLSVFLCVCVYNSINWLWVSSIYLLCSMLILTKYWIWPTVFLSCVQLNSIAIAISVNLYLLLVIGYFSCMWKFCVFPFYSVYFCYMEEFEMPWAISVVYLYVQVQVFGFRSFILIAKNSGVWKL